MCDCAKKIEDSAKEKVRAQLPEGYRDYSCELQGYAFLLGGKDGVSMKNALNLRISYDAPKKKGGGFTHKKQDMSMVGNYCMFCGEKYAKDEDEEKTDG